MCGVSRWKKNVSDRPGKNPVCCSVCQEQFFGGFVDLASISSFVVLLLGKLCCSAADAAFGFLSL